MQENTQPTKSSILDTELIREITKTKMFKRMLNTTSGNIQLALEKYTTWKDKRAQIKRKRGYTVVEQFIKKYGESIGLQKYQEMIKTRTNKLRGQTHINSRIRLINEYGEIDGVKKYNERRELYFIKKFGKELGNEKYQKFL